ncbi:MAG TPA: serine/threonine-protein kinase [Mycobacterium sp.]|nr:serine/threonine-protein kinase [Mycobacterium sp.]
MAASPTGAAPPPRIIASRYREIGPLGNGLCGQTVRCFDIHEGDEVAVKLIDTFGGRIGQWDEARYLRQLTDPHILPIRNALEDLGQPILVTEIAEGGTVDDRLQQGGGLFPLEAIDWVRHACLGLHRAHSDGLLHNDVKPANLFLTATARCMVGDFGFATLIDPTTGMARVIGTTPATGSPEAITGALTGQPLASVTSDVYSIAATLYWLLAGVPPIPAGMTHQQARDFVVAGNVIPLKVVAPHLGDYTCRVVAKAMASDPNDRHQTATGLYADLGSARTAEARGRQWHTVLTHPGHEKCWECPSLGAKQALRVCLLPVGSAYEIRAEHISSNRRYRLRKTTNARKASDLRKMFKDV